jgi:hypothetical protein
MDFVRKLKEFGGGYELWNTFTRFGSNSPQLTVGKFIRKALLESGTMELEEHHSIY